MSSGSFFGDLFASFTGAVQPAEATVEGAAESVQVVAVEENVGSGVVEPVNAAEDNVDAESGDVEAQEKEVVSEGTVDEDAVDEVSAETVEGKVGGAIEIEEGIPGATETVNDAVENAEADTVDSEKENEEAGGQGLVSDGEEVEDADATEDTASGDDTSGKDEDNSTDEPLTSAAGSESDDDFEMIQMVEETAESDVLTEQVIDDEDASESDNNSDSEENESSDFEGSDEEDNSQEVGVRPISVGMCFFLMMLSATITTALLIIFLYLIAKS